MSIILGSSRCRSVHFALIVILPILLLIAYLFRHGKYIATQLGSTSLLRSAALRAVVSVQNSSSHITAIVSTLDESSITSADFRSSASSESIANISHAFTTTSTIPATTISSVATSLAPSTSRLASWFFLNHGQGVPVQCGAVDKIKCASDNGIDCKWGALGQGFTDYQVLHGINPESALEIDCPSWPASDGSDACDRLRCYKDPRPRYPSTSVTPIPALSDSLEKCDVKVYIYQTILPPFQDLGDFHNHSQKILKGHKYGVFGQNRKSHPYYHVHGNAGVAEMVLHRLWVSHCRVTDHRDADLFFLPILVKSKGVPDWSELCAKDHRFAERKLRAMVPHLTRKTAARHFIIFDESWFVITCMTFLWMYPSAFYKRIARLSPDVSLDLRSKTVRDCLAKQHSDNHYSTRLSINHDPEHTVPRHYTIPWPAAVHWSKRYPPISAVPGPRPILVAFLGSSRHGDPVRNLIGKLCDESGTTINVRRYSEIVNLQTDLVCMGGTRARQQIGIEVKQHATFCLEPIGDSIGRKSLGESYAFGCIPVFIGCAQTFQFPDLWDGWQEHAYVQVDREKLMRGKLDLLGTLRKFSRSRIETMQHAIQRFGSRFQINLEEVPGVEDMLSIMLRVLHKSAQLLE